MPKELECVFVNEGGHGFYRVRYVLDVAKLFGAHRTLEKPFKIEDMLKAVREELQSKQGNQTAGPHS